MIKGTILTSAVAMQNNLSSRLFNIERRLYRLTNQIIILSLGKLVGDYEIVEKVSDRRQIQGSVLRYYI